LRFLGSSNSKCRKKLAPGDVVSVPRGRSVQEESLLEALVKCMPC